MNQYLLGVVSSIHEWLLPAALLLTVASVIVVGVVRQRKHSKNQRPGSDRLRRSKRRHLTDPSFDVLDTRSAR